MVALRVNPSWDGGAPLDGLYRGDLALFTDVASVSALVTHARAELAELFAPHDPEFAHLHFDPAKMATVLGKWKPRFMHDERTRALTWRVVEELGLSPDVTYVDVAKVRTAYPLGHLNTGIAYAFSWHRDTWYAAPAQQINWWLPIFDITPDNAMRFDLSEFDRPVPNNSQDFDYYALNRARLRTATQVTTETQARPEANGHTAREDFVPLLRPGSVLAFSGAHLHATVLNTSGRARYSIDVRTVDIRHAAQGIGAPLVDVHCTGTSLRDFIGMRSGERVDEELAQRLYGSPPEGALLVFDKDTSLRAADALPLPDDLLTSGN